MKSSSESSKKKLKKFSPGNKAKVKKKPKNVWNSSTESKDQQTKKVYRGTKKIKKRQQNRLKRKKFSNTADARTVAVVETSSSSSTRPSGSGAKIVENGGCSDAGKKRVSFSRDLELGKTVGLTNGGTDDDSGGRTFPTKSILKRKSSSQAAAAGAPPSKKPRGDKHDQQNKLASTNSSVLPKGKKKAKVAITRKLKQELLELSPKDRRKKLLELKEKRRPYYALAKAAKKLWEVVRSSKSSSAEKERAVTELAALVKGKARQLIYAHDTARVIQCLVSLKRTEISGQLYDELKAEMLHMAKNKYACFFVMKMFKYGSAEQRLEIVRSLKGHYGALFAHNYGSDVVEYVFSQFANAKQRSDIVCEFFGAQFKSVESSKVETLATILEEHPQKRATVLSALKSYLLSLSMKNSFSNSLAHHLYFEFLEHCSEEERSEIIDAIKERVVEIVHTRDGSRVAMKCIWFGSSKERKVVVQSFKGLVTKAAMDKYGMLVLCSLFDAVDDTKLIDKIILKELAGSVKTLLDNSHGIKLFNYLRRPRDGRFLQKETIELLKLGDGNPNSKKDDAVRRQELWSAIEEPLMEHTVAHLRDIIFHKTMSVFLLSMLERSADSADRSKEVQVSEKYLVQSFDQIAEIAKEEFIPCNMEEQLHLVEHGRGHYVVKHLLTCDKFVAAAGVPTLCASLAENLSAEQLAGWTACNKGCFILSRMFESGVESAKTAVVAAAQLAKKRLKKSSTLGAKKLLERLQEIG